MNKKQIIDEVSSFINPIIEENKFELVDVEFVKEGPQYYLRIYIDKDGGVDIDDCVTISKLVETLLDDKDIIEPAYILEVSSPGLDRILKKDKDFERFKDNMIDIKFYNSINGSKKITAKLISKENETLTIEDDGVITKIDMKNIAKVRLAIMF